MDWRRGDMTNSDKSTDGPGRANRDCQHAPRGNGRAHHRRGHGQVGERRESRAPMEHGYWEHNDKSRKMLGYRKLREAMLEHVKDSRAGQNQMIDWKAIDNEDVAIIPLEFYASDMPFTM